MIKVTLVLGIQHCQLVYVVALLKHLPSRLHHH